MQFPRSAPTIKGGVEGGVWIMRRYSLVPRRSGRGGGERAPGTHCLHMRLISQISGEIVYFSNLPCYVDVIILKRAVQGTLAL